jgi:pimeloyl-ACP methyl ester carboxylesterase
MSNAASDRSATARPPSPWLLLLEWRAPFEWAAAVASIPWLASAPRGDGHAVMVFPGLAANDLSTLPLRRFLASLGHDVHAWGQGFNLGREGVLERCCDAVRAQADRTGRAVSLVGWSLGGVYARETAKALPDEVRAVVTLGSPFADHPHATNAWRVYEMLSGQRADDPEMRARLGVPPPQPTTSIYSRTDGVVSWRCSVDAPRPLAENIEVRASHIGMGANPIVLYAVADRLAQPEGRWQPFDPGAGRHWLYPAAERRGASA